MSAFMREVHVQSFAQKERQACLELWLLALQVRRPAPVPLALRAPPPARLSH
jgi:hypothetical protein